MRINIKMVRNSAESEKGHYKIYVLSGTVMVLIKKGHFDSNSCSTVVTFIMN